ncbi:chromatin modification-related protein EAF7-domain-containing protein [Phanerochaete sordida]|uniref:Chromatin modification-related protein EAF7-domain-containing protein n=1 Tax=Phanerochaete sordida TaxID=48140 RepID=A0A9P3LLB8_9APHY|nr:chromatin modification-related protein EAF7-domain-containing protein [Phanerochaete sordida]
MRARPVGMHRQFHVLAIRNYIHRATDRWVPPEELWRKLKECYDLDNLEALELDGFEVPGEKRPTPAVFAYPPTDPADNLQTHPYFRAEYALPDDPTIDAEISRRRMRASVSVDSGSPAPSPVHEKPAPSGRVSKRKKNQAQVKNMAGLVAGDSDSSALTQESGDESAAPTPTTNPDAGTEYADGEAEREQSPEAPKRKGKGRRNSTATRGKPGTSTRGGKKRKRG